MNHAINPGKLLRICLVCRQTHTLTDLIPNSVRNAHSALSPSFVVNSPTIRLKVMPFGVNNIVAVDV